MVLILFLTGLFLLTVTILLTINGYAIVDFFINGRYIIAPLSAGIVTFELTKQVLFAIISIIVTIILFSFFITPVTNPITQNITASIL